MFWQLSNWRKGEKNNHLMYFDVHLGYFWFFPVYTIWETSLVVTNLAEMWFVWKGNNLLVIMTSEMSEKASKDSPCRCIFSVCSKR